VGSFGVLGLWLWLSLALLVSVAVAVGSVWLSNRAMRSVGGNRTQLNAFALPHRCGTGFRRLSRIHRGRCVGAVFVGRGKCRP
jgi:hypothetical protein